MRMNKLYLKMTVGEAVEIGKVMIKDGYCDALTVLANLCQIKHKDNENG